MNRSSASKIAVFSSADGSTLPVSMSLSTLVEPQLTTINVPKDIFGPAAVDLLISRLDQGREQSLKVEIGTSLVKRGSVKKITD